MCAHLEPLSSHVVFSHVFFVALKVNKGISEKKFRRITFRQKFIPESADHDVSSTDKLQPRLENDHVQDVDEVAGVVGQQPQMDILRCLVGKRPPDRDQPHVPVPGCHHAEEPDHVDQICGADGTRQKKL